MKNYVKLYGFICALIICVIGGLIFYSPETYAEKTERKTIKVGYYPVSDYQEKKSDGTYTGFSYDYYIQIQKYTRWKYDFVEASYAECMKMLMNGEIDVMSGLTEDAEKEDKVIYSDYSNSNSQYKMYARKDDSNLFYESYDTFDGCKVGMVTGVKTNELERYCEEHNFSVKIINYNSYEEMEKALANKKVDMLCGASLSDNANTKIVARMKKRPLYYAVSKSKPEIATQLNDALSKIVDNNPEFYAQMSEKYKILGANAAATFTRQEDAYINSGKQIYLVVNDNLPPISWYDEDSGEYRGISIDVANELEKYSGLNIEPIASDEFAKMVEENPDIMGDALVMSPDDSAWANTRSIMMTNHVVNATIVMISRTGKTVDVTKQGTVIALPKDFYISYRMKDVMADKDVRYYDTVQECMDAVNNGKADATFQNSLVARYYLSMLKYTNLYIYAESGFTENLSYGVYMDSDTPLLSILDKSLLCVGSTRINEIAIQYAHADEKLSIEGIYYSNPVLVIGIITVICVLIGFIVYFRIIAVNAVKSGKQEKMLARFMGYVCAANDDVLEVNLNDYSAQSYSLNDNGKVTINEIPYKQIHGQNYMEQIYPEDFEKLKTFFTEESMDEMINHPGKANYFECKAKNTDGEYQWYSYSLQAIPKDKEHPRNFILFKRNIDNVKKEEEKSKQALEDALETAKDASEAKGNFLSRVSHEIRTPLNAVIGYISIARQPDSDKKKIEHCLENSEIASKHLLSILNDVLDMSSIESGKMKLVKEPFNLKELLQNIQMIYSQQAASKGVAFKLDMGKLGREWLIGDRLRVNQILYNLVSNAIKFTDKDGQVSIKTTQIDSSNNKCRIKFEVTDNGIGMSDEYMNRLFKPFEQESAKTAQKFGGTGLGLSIAWNLITMMGGSIEVMSKPGKGTIFTVIVNFEYSDEHYQKNKDVDFSKVRALIICGEKDDSNNIKDILKQCGIKSDVVTDVKKAVKRIISRKQTDYSYQFCIMKSGLDNEVLEKDIKEIHTDADEMIPVISESLSKTAMLNLITEILEKCSFANEVQLEQRDFHGIHILLAEDNEMNLEIAVDVLSRSGLIVDIAVNGEEALQKFMESEPGTYQVILMDIQMPVMDGYEATRQIRASAHAQAKEIPIIATTANAFSEDVSAALACGMNGHISKPIDYKKLYQVMDKYIQ